MARLYLFPKRQNSASSTMGRHHPLICGVVDITGAWGVF